MKLSATQWKAAMGVVSALLALGATFVGEEHGPLFERLDIALWALAGVLIGGAAWRRPGDIPPAKKPRPGRSVPPGGPMGLLLVLVALVSCAATPLQTHATIADGTAQLIDEAGKLIKERALAGEESVLAISKSRAEAEARVADQRRAYAPLEAAYEALRLAHAAYVDAIKRADEAGLDRPDPDVARALTEAWHELVGRAQMLGLLLPTPPPELAPLLGGGP